MDLNNESFLSGSQSGWPIIWHGKNCDVGHYLQTFQPDFFIPAMLIGTYDFYHSITLPVPLSLAWGHKVNKKQT